MLGRAKLLPGLTMSVSVFMLAAAGLHLVVAHHEIVTHENHEASISADHWVGNVCDMKYDGNAATAYFVLENGQTVSFIDPNGDGVEDPGHNGCWELTLESAAVFMGGLRGNQGLRLGKDLMSHDQVDLTSDEPRC